MTSHPTRKVSDGWPPSSSPLLLISTGYRRDYLHAPSLYSGSLATRLPLHETTKLKLKIVLSLFLCVCVMSVCTQPTTVSYKPSHDELNRVNKDALVCLSFSYFLLSPHHCVPPTVSLSYFFFSFSSLVFARHLPVDLTTDLSVAIFSPLSTRSYGR